jgi:RNA-directed DNA polymerase
VGEASNVTAGTEPDYPEDEGWLDAVVERENMIRALKRVQGNKGAPGIDGMTVEDLESYLKTHWARIKAELLEGRYKPQAVRGVEIPKPDGGVRKLGIPTAVDRRTEGTPQGSPLSPLLSNILLDVSAAPGT